MSSEGWHDNALVPIVTFSQVIPGPDVNDFPGSHLLEAEIVVCVVVVFVRIRITDTIYPHFLSHV